MLLLGTRRDPKHVSLGGQQRWTRNLCQSFRRGIGADSFLFDEGEEAKAVKKGDCAKNAEGTIDQSPVEWDVAQWAADQGEGNHGETREDSCIKGPATGAGGDERANKKEGDHDVCKGQPVGSVCQPRVCCIGVFQAAPDRHDPKGKAAVSVWGLRRSCTEGIGEDAQFKKEREGRDAADDESHDETKHHGSETK